MMLQTETYNPNIIRYQVDENNWLDIDKPLLKYYSIEEILKGYNVPIQNERVNVIQNGKKIGSVPSTWVPEAMVSKSFFYIPRSGDFVFRNGDWIACKSICPGDFDAIDGFEWRRNA